MSITSKVNRMCRASVFAALASWDATAQPADTIPARHIFSLDDVEITSLIDDVATITGYTFVLHPDVTRTRVTILSQESMTTDEVFQVFLSTLRVHGFAAIPAGRGVYRVVPEQLAVGEAGVANAGPNTFITQVFQLDSFDAIEAAQMIKPLVDAEGTVTTSAQSNAVVVVDYASNMPRIREVVSALDGADRSQVRTLALKTIPAPEMASILTELLGERNGSPIRGFKVTAAPTGNAIILRGERRLAERALKLAAELDRAEPAEGSFRVFQLNNTSAESLVPVLEKIAGARGGEVGGSIPVTGGSSISFHAGSNSVIVGGTPEFLDKVARIVDTVDRRQAQVLVEALIVEVSDDTARQLGVQFQLLGLGGSTIPLAASNFSPDASNLLALAGALHGGDLTEGLFDDIDPADALASMLGRDGISAGSVGLSGDTLFGIVLNAVDRDASSRVLSQPFSMTVNNGTSSLLVGQDVPLTSGEVLGDSNSNPFRTVERKEIGVKLEVTPRISSNGTIQLDILQEVSSIAGAVSTDTPDLILNTRSVSTSVIADDGDLVVIGGLIEETEGRSASGIPLLSDIPVAGLLFRSSGRETTRTNLMIFIKPTIVRNRKDAEEITARSRNYIRDQYTMGHEQKRSAVDAFVEE